MTRNSPTRRPTSQKLVVWVVECDVAGMVGCDLCFPKCSARVLHCPIACKALIKEGTAYKYAAARGVRSRDSRQLR